MTTEAIHWMTVAETGAALRRSELSAREVVEGLLLRIQDSDPVTQAWVHVAAESAIVEAERADRDLAAGRDKGAFHGIGFAVKDVVAVAGMPMTVGSRVTGDFVPREDAPVVARLRAAGGICLGKTVTHEFAFGSTSPPSRNPWDGKSVPGGSSGGSAVAVAAGQAPAAIGTDCCCSVRNPAALTGICGIRPTFGRVSATGVVPASLGLDTVGPMCRTVVDTAIMLHAMCGYDPADPRSSAAPVPDFPVAAGLNDEDPERAVSGLRVGVPTEYFFEHVEPEVEQRVRGAVHALEQRGATIESINLPHAKYAVPAFFVLDIAEEAALQHDHLRGRGGRLGEDVQQWAEIGSLILAKDYIRAQQMRALIIDDWGKAFEHVDVVVTPATAAVAKQPVDHPIFIDIEYPDGFVEDVVFAYGRFLIPVSLAGLPALVVPCGLGRDGMPVGVQVVAPAFDETTAFRVGAAIEAEVGLGAARPAAVGA